MVESQGRGHFARRRIPGQHLASLDPDFETKAAARNEDRARRELIRDTLDKAVSRPNPRLRRAKLKCANRSQPLDRAHQLALLSNLRDTLLSPTLASSVCLRQLRMNMTGAILAMVEGIPLAELRTFTVLNNGWRLPAAKLDTTSARRIKQQFLTHLRRAGVLQVPGFLVAFLHGEFEPTSGVYVLHFHGVTNAARAKALDRLKVTSRGEARGWGYDQSPTGSRPIVRKHVVNPLRQITYLLKAYWPEKAVRPTGSGERRDRRAQRIRNPYHTHHLLWLDRQQFTDIAIFNGCRLLRSGELRLARPVAGCKRAKASKGGG